MTEEKSKYELTVDFIMIIGKYFKTKFDFINIMKVCKNYEELVLMYHFNPISDISLFKNIQTQHFYDKEDGNIIFVNCLQLLKHSSLILVIPSGIIQLPLIISKSP